MNGTQKILEILGESILSLEASRDIQAEMKKLAEKDKKESLTVQKEAYEQELAKQKQSFDNQIRSLQAEIEALKEALHEDK